METQLEDIIQKIQDEGVAAAQARAKEITDLAEKQAAQRVQAAQDEAARIVTDAEKERDRLIASGEAALQQAGRDLILAVQKRISSMFEAVINDTLASALSPERVGEIIVALVQAWKSDNDGAFEVLVPEADRDAIEATVRTKLTDSIGAGVDIRPVPSITAGFRIGRRDGAVYYDFSSESLGELLAAFLNPRLGEIMKKAAGE